MFSILRNWAIRRLRNRWGTMSFEARTALGVNNSEVSCTLLSETDVATKFLDCVERFGSCLRKGVVSVRLERSTNEAWSEIAIGTRRTTDLHVRLLNSADIASLGSQPDVVATIHSAQFQNPNDEIARLSTFANQWVGNTERPQRALIVDLVPPNGSSASERFVESATGILRNYKVTDPGHPKQELEIARIAVRECNLADVMPMLLRYLAFGLNR